MAPVAPSWLEGAQCPPVPPSWQRAERIPLSGASEGGRRGRCQAGSQGGARLHPRASGEPAVLALMPSEAAVCYTPLQVKELLAFL